MRAYKKIANADEMIPYWYAFSVIFAGSVLGFAIRFSDKDGARHPTFWSWVISVLLCALLLYPVMAGIKGLAAIAKRVDANAEYIGALEVAAGAGEVAGATAPVAAVAPVAAPAPLPAPAQATAPAPIAPPAPAPVQGSVPRASTGVAHTPPPEYPTTPTTPPTAPPAPPTGP